MTFLNPFYLWALLGLAVPVAIHLWSRKEGRTIKVGSIQFLKESDSQQASSVKLNEIWLLLLRMLALALLVLIIAGPVLKTEDSGSALTYLIEPSLLQEEGKARIPDSIYSGENIRLLAKDFPLYTVGEGIPGQEIPDYWQLAREMDNINADSIVVFISGYASGFKGKRPETGKHINWIQINPEERIEAPVAAVRKGDNIELISVSGDHTYLDIEKEIMSFNNSGSRINSSGDSITIDHGGINKVVPLKFADTLNVVVFADGELQDQMPFIRASLRAISTYTGTAVKFTELSSENNLSDENDLSIWLSLSPPAETGSKILLWKPDSLANSLVERGKGKNEYYLTGTLNSENITEENLPEQLLQLLEINEEIKAEISNYDRRVMPLGEIAPVMGSMGGRMEEKEGLDVSKYFWILFLIILIGERGLSVYRKQ